MEKGPFTDGVGGNEQNNARKNRINPTVHKKDLATNIVAEEGVKQTV
jgi:hypothetical protein